MLDNDKWKMHTAYVQENKSIYLSLYEDLFENGCVYIYIYICSLDECFRLFIMSLKLRLLKKLLNASFLYLPRFKLIP